MQRVALFFLLNLAVMYPGAAEPDQAVPAPHIQVQRNFTGAPVRAVTPDRHFAVTTDYSDWSLYVWDLRSGKLLAKHYAHTSRINEITVSPDGQLVANNCWDGYVMIRKILDGTVVWEGPSGRNFGRGPLVFSPDSSKLYFLDEWGVRMLDISGKSPGFSTGRNHTIFATFALTPDGKDLMAGGPEVLALYDALTGTLKIQYQGVDAEINNIRYNTRLKLFYTSDRGDRLTVWSPESDKKLRQWPTESDYGAELAEDTPGGQQAVVVNTRKRVNQFYDLTSGKLDQEIPLEPAAGLRFPDGTSIAPFGQPAEPVSHASLSPGGNFFGASRNAWYPALWNLRTAEPVTGMFAPAPQDEFPRIRMLDDRTAITFGSFMSLWDMDSRKMKSRVKMADHFIDMVVAPNRQFVWGHFRTDKPGAGALVKMGFTPPAMLGFTFDADVFRIYDISSDSRQFISSDMDKKNPNLENIQVWDVGFIPMIIKRFPLQGGVAGLNSLCFLPDNRRIAIGNSSTSVDIYDIITGKLVRSLKGHKDIPFAVAGAPDKNKLASAGRDMSLKIWNPDSGALLQEFQLEHFIQSLAWFPDSRHLLAGASDGTCLVIDSQTGFTTTFISDAAGAKWLIYNSDGYWDGSPDCGDLVAMTRNLDYWNIDQFAVRNNRPDLVLAKLPGADPAMIDYYHALFQKRLRKLGFVDAQGNPDPGLLQLDYHVPQAGITASKQTGKNLRIDFVLKDQSVPLQRYNIWVNDVPLFGASGKVLKARAGAEIKLSETVELGLGSNKIEVSCRNANGAESLRAATSVTYTPPVSAAAGKPDCWVLAFGVSRYKDDSLNLQFADKDARDLASTFAAMKDGYGTVHTRVYTNEEVTVAAIKAARDFVAQAKSDDTLVLFIAGHGVHDADPEATYYFLTHDADIRNLKGTAANFELVEELLQGIAPRNKLFLMDTCESGEADDKAEAAVFDLAESRGVKARTTRGLTKVKRDQKAPPRTFLARKDRYISNDLVRRSGAIVFSSCRGGEFSYESETAGNGFFTKKIIEGLQGGARSENGQTTVDSLREYVTQGVASLSSDLQHPVVDRDNLYQKFGFPSRR